jgi:hypothetical protein
LRPLRIKKFKCVESLSRRAAFLDKEAALPRKQINDGMPIGGVKPSIHLADQARVKGA